MENRKSFVPRAVAAASRRFTTMEGWREVQSNVYKAAGAGLRIITVDPEFDPDQHHEYASLQTRSSTRTSKNDANLILKTTDEPTLRALEASEARTTWRTSNPFDDINTVTPHIHTPQDPFQDSFTIEQDPISAPVEAEQEYHIFNRRQKWLVILIIGGAGLFSGLSSNIYFPALQAIANVSLITFSFVTSLTL
jgi:hypothetical protein